MSLKPFACRIWQYVRLCAQLINVYRAGAWLFDLWLNDV